MTIRYGSVCSGIEAATAAWHPLGWEAAFFSEIERIQQVEDLFQQGELAA